MALSRAMFTEAQFIRPSKFVSFSRVSGVVRRIPMFPARLNNTKTHSGLDGIRHKLTLTRTDNMGHLFIGHLPPFIWLFVKPVRLTGRPRFTPRLDNFVLGECRRTLRYILVKCHAICFPINSVYAGGIASLHSAIVAHGISIIARRSSAVPL